MTRENAIDAYCAAWDEPDLDRRNAILSAVCAEDATYTDLTVHCTGIEELAAHIGVVLARYLASHIVRTSEIDTYGDLARFAWKKVLSDGTSLLEGTDFAEFAPDGRLRRIVGFFGPLRVR